MNRFPTHLLLVWIVVLSSCSDNAAVPIVVDASTDAIVVDTALPIDAIVCEITNYPQRAGSIDLALETPTPLNLDGSGERCEQIHRALMSTSSRPAALSTAEQGFDLRSCMFDELINADILRLRKNTFAGQPLYGTEQDILAHVKRDTNNLSFLAGRVIPISAAQNAVASCVSESQVRATIPGTKLGYQKFEACRLLGAGEYTIAEDDLVTIKAQGWFVDSQDQLRRVWVAPVFLLPAHVNSEIINSDAFCCVDDTVANCVGSQLIFDAVTGELLSQIANCRTC